MLIRPIQSTDDAAIAAVIRQVLAEHNVPNVGTAYADASLDCMFKTYAAPDSAYFVVENNGLITGGAGISPLQNGPQATCELQKMYFLPQARGKGIGSRIMEECLDFAKASGYKNCYLETMPYMADAQKLYAKYGFEYLAEPMGNTGHSSCPVWMLVSLANILKV